MCIDSMEAKPQTMPRLPSDSDRFKDYIDWAVRGAVGALCTGSVALVYWGVDIQTRVHDLEGTALDNKADVSTLIEKQDSYQQVRVDLAVIQSQSMDNAKKLERIENLLLQISGPKSAQ